METFQQLGAFPVVFLGLRILGICREEAGFELHLWHRLPAFFPDADRAL